MITFRFYDPEEKVDYVWYKSSNVAFSKCDDKVNDYKDLTVVFNNGATYKYKKVNVNDYLMFVAGGTNGSNGKAPYASGVFAAPSPRLMSLYTG